MTAPTAPAEDRLDTTAFQGARPWPWRGRRAGEPVALDPEAPQAFRKSLAEYEDGLRTALALPANAGVGPAGLRYLDGEADALGAAAVSALMAVAIRRPYRGAHMRPELDAWVLEHGLPFATAALTATFAFQTRHYYQRDPLEQTVLAPLGIDLLGFLDHDLGDGIVALRSLLAAASDEEHQEVVAAVAAVRDEPVRRFLASLFLPEREDWALEVLQEYDAEPDAYTDRLVWRFVGGPQALAAVRRPRLTPWSVSPQLLAELLANLGAASFPVLAASLRRTDAAGRGLLLEALALLPTDEAFTHLLDRIAEPHVHALAVRTAERYPHRAARLLAAAQAPPELRPMLAGVAAAVPEHLRGGLADLLDTAPAPATAPADLPPLLVSPPWDAKRPKRKAAVIDGLTAPDRIEVRWAEGERERALDYTPYAYFARMSEAEWKEHFKPDMYHGPQRGHLNAIIHADDAVAAYALERWDGTTDYHYGLELMRILGRFESAAVPKLLRALRTHPKDHETLVPIYALEAARLAADWLRRLKTARAGAVAWLDRHGADGARLLVPDALGKDRGLRQNAEGALLHLASRSGPAIVEAAAESYGPEAARAIRDLLDGDPLEPRGVKVPKLGAWTDPALLPQVLLKGREAALPPESVPHLITVLALTDPDFPYAGIEVVAEACDRDSLTRFSRALFLRWISAGAPSKDGWALTQLAHFADDETVRLLAGMVREWPGQSQHKRAVNGLGVLGAIGTEEALRAIQGIADKVKFKALKEEAGRQIEAIAEGLGLSREQLADRLVPDFGLGDEALVLDYGPRRFTVVFDEQLKPYVRDETGKPRKSLPKPGAKDDTELAEAAYKRFAALKKDLRTASADQVNRLEAAMVAARTWTGDEFRRFFATHPLVKHLARRLIWQADGTGFRIAEDGTLSDAADDAFTLPDDATVRLAHPMLMDPEEAKAWGDLLADYEILQPFDQLGRPVMSLTEDERRTGRLERFEDREVEVGRLLGLTKRGWRRAAPEDGGVEPGICYPLPDGWFVSVCLEPGIWVGMIAENPIQKLCHVNIRPREDYRGGDGEPVAEGLSRLTLSEILSDLERLIAPELR